VVEPHQTHKHERVWDPLVRLFHWSLVVAFVTAWFGRGEAWWHEGAGKFILCLIIFRVVWGFIGTGAARFETFLRGPHATLKYVFDVVRGRPAHFSGHNPAGAAMIALMLVTLSVTTASGILMTTTKLWGNASVEYIHGQSANLMLVLIGGHLFGVLLASLQHKENLIFSMITGWKSVPISTEPYLGDLRWTFKRLLLAGLVLLGAVGLWQTSTTALNASFWRMNKILTAAAKTAGCEVTSVSEPTIIAYPNLVAEYEVTTAHPQQLLTVRVPFRTVLLKKPPSDFGIFATECVAFKVEEPPQIELPIVKFRSAIEQVGISGFVAAHLQLQAKLGEQVETFAIVSPPLKPVVVRPVGSPKKVVPLLVNRLTPVLKLKTKPSVIVSQKSVRRIVAKAKQKQKRKRKGRRNREGAFQRPVPQFRSFDVGGGRHRGETVSRDKQRSDNSGRGSSGSGGGGNSGRGGGDDD
jgi:cytochrome b